MSYIKKQNAFGWLLCAGALFSLISLVIYVVNVSSGFLAGSGIDALVIIAPVVAILGSVALFLFSDKLDERLVGLATFLIGMLLALATVQFFVVRIDAMGELLNPIPHTEAEISAVNVAITGIVFYAVSMVIYVATTIAGRLTKKNEE